MKVEEKATENAGKTTVKRHRGIKLVISTNEDSIMSNINMSQFDAKERSFADELAHYENEWVAISRSGKVEKIVASGKSVIDAKREADAKGIKNAVYRKVPSTHKVFIA